MNKVRYILNYVQYLRKAVNKYDIHSPFLYELITEVFEDKCYYPGYHIVESQKENLLKNDNQIEVTDLGAGSVKDNNKYRAIKDITRYSSKPAKYGRLLFRLSQHFKPGHILELGTSMGLSSAYLALGHQNSDLITVEGCPNISNSAKENIKLMGINNITVINGNFDSHLPGILEKIPHLDFAFIDGNHCKEPTIRYFEQCLKKTVNTSCIVFDDIHWSGEMEEAWNYIINHQSITLSIDLFYLGIVFLRKELSKQHFIIRF